MGADGGIDLYDITKANNQFGEEVMSVFLDKITDAQTYIHTVKNPTGDDFPVLTVYGGDNMYCLALFDQIFYNQFDGKIDEELANKIPRAKEIVDYMVKECKMGYWEVWT